MESEVREAPICFYEIDLLRFLAALSVVLFHYTYFAALAEVYSPISYSELGRFGRYGAT
jgi:peptidoglycan/LPS O-acetylase OafA/YrhL